MRLLCGNVWAEVRDASAAEERFLDRYLSVPVQGREHSPAYRRRVWDGLQHLYKDGRFPVGLVRLVRAAVARDVPGSSCDVADERGLAPAARSSWSEARLGWLRDYQLEACRAGIDRTRGIVKMPTGAGKTSVFVGWALGFGSLRWLVMVDTADLVEQAAERFERYSGGEPAGRLCEGRRDLRRFTVATLQSLHSRLEAGDARVVDLVENAQGMVVDECQILPAETFGAVALRCGAYYRFGTSATPLSRGDSRDFATIGILGSVLAEVPRKLLEERGLIARSEVSFVEYMHPDAEGLESYQAAYKELVVEAEARNRLVVEMSLVTPKPQLLFVKAIDHGRRLERMLSAHLRADFVHGEADALRRSNAIERLQRGDLDVLVTSRIFNKGVDIPLVRGAVNAAGGKGEIDALQRLGRILRAAAGKDLVVFRDVLDRRNRWFRNQATKRMEAYKEDGHQVHLLKREDLLRLPGA